MSRRYDGVLRTARGRVIPKIPELAPGLRRDSKIILRAVRADVERQGHDPDAVTWPDYNRAERQTISGFLIHEQAGFLVEGTGTEARFRLDQAKPYREAGPASDWPSEISLLLDAGARYVKQEYGRGKDPEHRWWRPAARRYLGLHLRANFHAMRTDEGPDSVPETWFLGRALRSQGLPSAAGIALELMQGDIPDDEKRRAFYDTAVPMIGFTSLHAKELAAHSREARGPKGPVSADFRHHQPSGHWRMKFDSPEDRRRFMPRLDVPTARLKCPAHAAINLPPEEGAPPRAEAADTSYTALQNLAYASINLAIEQYNLP